MLNKLDKILIEEVNSYVDNIPSKELLSTMQELLENQKIIDSLNKVSKQLYDYNNQITEENWKFFKDSLVKLCDYDLFKRKAEEINLKLFSTKYFTELDFILPENLENVIKFELKNYFSKLLTDDPKTFTVDLFNLPFEFVSLVIRYIGNILCPEKKNDLSPSIGEANLYLKQLKDKKHNLIDCIDKLSQGTQNTLSIEDMQELLDVKAFFKYNAINVGVLEYLMRMLNSQISNSKLIEQIGEDKVELLKQQILYHPGYIEFINKIKNGITIPYFTHEGLQNPEREKRFKDYVDILFHPENYIPKAKETKQGTPELPKVLPLASTPVKKETKPEELTPAKLPGSIEKT